MWAGPDLLGRQLAAEPISPGSGSPCAAHAFSPSPSPQHVCSRPAEGLGHRPAPPGGLLVPVDDGVEEAAVAPAKLRVGWDGEKWQDSGLDAGMHLECQRQIWDTDSCKLFILVKYK